MHTPKGTGSRKVRESCLEALGCPTWSQVPPCWTHWALGPGHPPLQLLWTSLLGSVVSTDAPGAGCSTSTKEVMTRPDLLGMLPRLGLNIGMEGARVEVPLLGACNPRPLGLHPFCPTPLLLCLGHPHSSLGYRRQCWFLHPKCASFPRQHLGGQDGWSMWCGEGTSSEIGHCSQGRAVGHRHTAPHVSFTKCSWPFLEQAFGECGSLRSLCHRGFLSSPPGNITTVSQDPGRLSAANAWRLRTWVCLEVQWLRQGQDWVCLPSGPQPRLPTPSLGPLPLEAPQGTTAVGSKRRTEGSHPAAKSRAEKEQPKVWGSSDPGPPVPLCPHQAVLGLCRERKFQANRGLALAVQVPGLRPGQGALCLTKAMGQAGPDNGTHAGTPDQETSSSSKVSGACGRQAAMQG